MNPYREDFPIFKTNPGGKPLVYLDNAATTQKPEQVLRVMHEYYTENNANPHRGLYHLSMRATEVYENARETVRNFINAGEAAEVIFTRNASESLNLLGYCYARENLKPGDKIVLPVSEHHSNLVTWQQAARATGAVLEYLYPQENGRLAEQDIAAKIVPGVKIVALAHVSNVLGVVNPVADIIRRAHEVGAVVVLDCAQSIPHYPLDVRALDVDFAVFSAHKMLGPMGVGVLYGKRALLEAMPPFLFGGDMIEYVYEQEASFAPLPQKFEAGTPNVSGAAGLAEAVRYIQKVGYEVIERIEAELLAYAVEGLRKIPHITVYGDMEQLDNRCGVISFNVDDVHPHDVATVLDADGVAIRAGNHCAQPLLRYLNVNATCRASLYFYNTKEDIDRFLAALSKVRGWLGYGA